MMTATNPNEPNSPTHQDEGIAADSAAPEPKSSADANPQRDVESVANVDDLEDVEDVAETDNIGSGGQGGNGGNGHNVVPDDDDGDDNGGDDPDTGGSFKPAPLVDGEFLVPLSTLGEWEHHPKKGSRTRSDHAAALTRTAINPGALRPIEVLAPVGGIYPIVDGRFLWCALKAAHPGNADVMVRCVLYSGNEAAAVAKVCDATLGMVAASAIERAQALLALKLTNDISQKEIAERYPRLTVSIVSDMLIAARMKKTYPTLFDILVEPDRAPIAYGCDIFTFKKRVSAEAFKEILDRAADLFENGERFKSNIVFDALQVERPSKVAAAGCKDDATDDTVEPVFGHDDQPVGNAERLTDGAGRLYLPPAAAVTEMTVMEREAAADAFIELIRRHFGLDRHA